MPVTDAARCYACRRPRLPADPFAAELKKLAIPYVIFPIEMRLDNSLRFLRAAARHKSQFLRRLRWTQRILPAPAWLVLTLPTAFGISPRRKEHTAPITFSPSVRIPRQICFRSSIRFKSILTFRYCGSSLCPFLFSALGQSLLPPSFCDPNLGLFCR